MTPGDLAGVGSAVDPRDEEVPPLLRHRRATVAVAALFAGAPPLATAVAVGGPVTGGEIPGGASAEVIFHRGPVALALRPICLIAAESPVQVEVAPATDQVADVDQRVPSAARPGAAEGRALASARPSGPAVEPTGSVEPIRDGGLTGLLALVATVCVVGVSAGAIRAIIAQRTTRTIVA
jgi:hypothetical protein